MNVRVVFYFILVIGKLEVLFNTFSIKNGGYAFVIRLDLMLSISLWKEFQLLQILNDLSIKHLILYETDVKLLKFKGRV